jgi:hypothetical protein
MRFQHSTKGVCERFTAAVGLPPRSSLLRMICTRIENLVPLAVPTSASCADKRPSTSTCLFRVVSVQEPSLRASPIVPGSSPASRKRPSSYPFRPTVAQSASRSFRCPSSRHQLGASTCCTEFPHSVLRAARGVPPTFDGLLRIQPYGLVSSRNHVQGSPFRDLTSSAEPRRVVLDQCPLAVRDAACQPKLPGFAAQSRLWPRPLRKNRCRLQGFTPCTGYDGHRLAVRPCGSSCPSWVFTPPGSETCAVGAPSRSFRSWTCPERPSPS